VTAVVTGYPRLVNGCAAIPVESGYLIEGGPSRELFTGRTARELFPRLLPLLDGTHQIGQIADLLGLPKTAVQRVVDVMRERAVLDVLPVPGAATPDPPPMGAFLRRFLPGAGDGVDRRLGAGAAYVTGTGALADMIAELLSRSGVGRVERNDPVPAVPSADAGARLIVAVDATAASSSGHPPTVPLLTVCSRAGGVLVGPLVHVPGGGCARCAAVMSREGQQTGPEAQRSGGTPVGRDAGVLGVAAGLAVGAVLRYLGGRGTSPVFDGTIEVGRDGVPLTHPPVRRPDCPDCGRPEVPLGDAERVEYAYEHTANAPFGGWDLDRLEIDGTRWNAPPRAYLTQPRVSIGRGRDGSTAGGIGPSGPGDDASRFTELLRMFAGTGSGVRHRDGPAHQPGRAPSVGCPGSTRAYLLGDLFGTGPRVYYLDGASGEFVVLPGDPCHVMGLGRTEAGDSKAGPVLVLTADLPALEPPLGSASRRVAYQDAGVVLAAITAAADAIGWRAHVRRVPVDPVSALLDLSPEREIVTAIVDLREATARDTASIAAGSGRRPSIAYHFGDRPVDANLVLRLAGEGRAGADALWSRNPGDGPALGCLLYTRDVRALAPGLYAMGGIDTRLDAIDARLDTIDVWLADRGVNAPALLLFTADLAGALSTAGALGYPAMLTRAGAAAELVRLAADRAGLASGLFARLPGWLAAAAAPQTLRGHRVLYGCAIGHRPDRPAPAPAQRQARRQQADRNQGQEHIPW
jgi:bacteriocin biosynthesis cyclodehydratase domain-containing protein